MSMNAEYIFFRNVWELTSKLSLTQEQFDTNYGPRHNDSLE